MDEKIRDWLRDISVEPTAENEQKWSDAANAVADSLDLETVPDIIRAALDIGNAESPMRGSIAGEIRSSDAAASTNPSDLEVQVLATIALRLLLDRQASSEANATALAIRCAGFGKQRIFKHVKGLKRRADEYLRDEGTRVRRFSKPSISVSPVESTIQTKIGTLASVLNGSDISLINEPLIEVLQALNQAISSTTNSTDNATGILSKTLSAALEESNIFWWVFSGTSRDREKKMIALQPAEIGLRAAKELSDLTELIPGPASAPGFLDWIINAAKKAGSKKSSVIDAVNLLDEPTRNSWVERYPSEGLEGVAPILVALRASCLTNEPDTWLPVHQKLSNFNIEAKVTVSELGHQLYDEMILVRAMTD